MSQVQFLVRHQLRAFARDGRARTAAWLVGVLLVLCLLADLARQRDQAAQRLRAVAEDSIAWVSQGMSHPHDAAHFGRYAFRPDGPLAMLDPGVSDFIGHAVRLEAHRRHPAMGRRVEAGTVFGAFPAPSVAFVLQVLVPLLIIFAGFNLFADEEVRGTTRLELSTGVSPRQLLLGRALGLFLPATLPLLLVVGAALVVLVARRAPGDAYLRLAGLATGTGLYLACFVAITMTCSIRARSARGALVVLLTIWTTSVWLIPRLAPTLVERTHPAMTMEAMDDAVSAETRRRREKDDPTSRRLAEVTDSLLREYGVASVEALPLNMGGVSLAVEEEITSAAYNARFDSVFADYEAQLRQRRWFSILSPLVPLTHWSTGMAGTDLPAQQRFLDAAEAYRYGLVQQLNHESRDRGGANGSAYVTDLRRLALDAPFRLTAESWRDVWQRRLADLLLMVVWVAVASWLALRASSRLSVT